jgi:hypothetical protein
LPDLFVAQVPDHDDIKVARIVLLFRLMALPLAQTDKSPVFFRASSSVLQPCRLQHDQLAWPVAANVARNYR